MFDFLKKTAGIIKQFDCYTSNYQSAAGQAGLPFISYTNWGMHLADDKDYAHAAEKLETAVLMLGNNPVPCINLGVVYARLKEYDKAEAVLKKAINRDSQNSCAYSVLSSVYSSMNRLQEAEELIKKAVKLSPADSDIYLNYGILCTKMQNRVQAAEMFEKSKFYNPMNIHAVFLLGVMYFEMEDIKRAYAEFKEAEEAAPDYKKLNYYLALCCSHEKDYAAAAAYSIKAVEEDPDNPAVYILAANAYLNLDEKEKVFSIYEQGEARGISCFEFFMSECTACEAYKNTVKAKECALKAIAIKSGNPEALYRMGACLKQEGDIDEALKYFEKSLAAAPDNAYAMNDAGLIYYSKRNYERAAQLFIKAAQLGRKSLYGLAAECFSRLGRIKKSLEYYEKMLEYYPDSIDTLTNCAAAHIASGGNREAYRKIRRASSLNKSSEKIMLIHSLAELKCGINLPALEKADKILIQNSSCIPAKLIKIQALINLNKTGGALKILDEIKTTEENSDMFTFLSYSAYKILAAETPSNYNESMLRLYSEKMKNIDADKIDRIGIISYINLK